MLLSCLHFCQTVTKQIKRDNTLLSIRQWIFNVTGNTKRDSKAFISVPLSSVRILLTLMKMYRFRMSRIVVVSYY